MKKNHIRAHRVSAKVMTWVLTFVMLLSLVPFGSMQFAEATEVHSTGYTYGVDEATFNERIEKIRSNVYHGEYPTGHQQGFAVDDEMKYVYASFTTKLAKVDIETGEVVGVVHNWSGHLGDMAYYDGRVYGSLEYKGANSFYIAVFDCDKIVGDVDHKDVMRTMYLPEVSKDYGAKVDGVSYAYGCSGIDGVAFGTIPGDDSGEIVMMVAYGIFDDNSSNVNDRDYQVLLQYDLDSFLESDGNGGTKLKDDKNDILDQSNHHKKGPEHEDKYFVLTGNTNYGIQNLEYDAESDNYIFAVYKGSCPEWPNYGIYYMETDTKPEVQELVMDPDRLAAYKALPNSNPGCTNMAQGKVLYLTDNNGSSDGSATLAYEDCTGPDGKTYRVWGSNNLGRNPSTGIDHIYGDYFYISQSGTGPTGGQLGYSHLYKYDRDKDTFSPVIKSMKTELLVDLSMDVEDLYEKNGVVYMKNAADPTGANDAIVEGTVADTGVQGGAGSALYFDAWKYPSRVDQLYLNQDTIALINEKAETADGNGTFSYSFWYKTTADTDGNFLPVAGFFREDNTYANIIQHRWRTQLGSCTNGIGAATAGAGNVSKDTYNPSNSNPGDASFYINKGVDGAWHHIVVTEQVGAISVYVDGTLFATRTVTGNHLQAEPFTEFIVGGGKGKVWQDMNNRGRVVGSVDQVKIWSGMLTAEEVAAEFAAKPADASTNPAHPGLVEATPNKTYAAYDKTDDKNKDLTVDAGAAVTSITGLTANTDYTVSGNNVTLKASWLAAQSCGIVTLKLNGTTDLDVTITDRKTPVLQFALDKAGVSGNVVTDSSVYKKNATAKNPAFGADQNDAADGAMVFDGYNYQHPTFVKLDETNADWLNSVIKNGYTLNFWANAGAENGTRMVFGGLYAADARPLGVVETNDGDGSNTNIDGKLKVQVNVGKAADKTAQEAKNTNTVDKNTWAMYTITYDKATNTVKLYVNNEKVAERTVAADIIGAIDQLFIGHNFAKYYHTSSGRDWTTRGGFYGSIADVAVYNYALPANEIAVLFGEEPEPEPEPPTIANTKPVVHWTMDGGTIKADGTIVDSGSNMVSYYENVTAVAGKDGTANGALYFDGTADSGEWSRVWLSDAGITELNKQLGEQVTIGFWVKPDNTKTNHKTAYTGNWSPIIGLYAANGQYRMVAEDRSGTLCLCSTPGGADRHTKANGTLNTAGQWYYVVMTYDGSSAIETLVKGTNSVEVGGDSRYRRIWIFDANGEVKFTRDTQLRPVGSGLLNDLVSFEVGGQFYKAWADTNVRGRFVGAIDDVRLYNIAVNAEEAKQMAGLVQNVGGTPAYAPEAEDAPLYFTAGSVNKTGEIADVTVTATDKVEGTIQSVNGLPAAIYTVSGNSIVIKGSYLMLQQPGALEFTVTTDKGTYPAAVYVTNGGSAEVEPYPVLYYKMDKADLTSATAANGTVSGTVKDYSGNGIDAQFEGIKTTNADKDKAADKSLFFNAYQETDSTRMFLDTVGVDYLQSVIDDEISYSFWFSSKRISSNYMPVIGVYGADNRPLAVAQFVATGSERPGNNPTQMKSDNSAPKGTDPVASFLAMPVGKKGTADGEYKDDATIVMRDASVWHHYVMTYSGSTGAFTIYMDGAKVHEGTAAKDQLAELAKFEMGGLSNPNYYNISTRSTQTRGRLEGNLDEVKVFNVALDADDVSKLYASGVTSNLPAEDPTNISDITNEFGLAVVDGLVVKVEGLNGPVEGAKVELPANLPVETVKVILPDGTPANTYTKVTVAEFNGDLSVGKPVTVQENASSTRTGEVTDEGGVVEYLTTFQDGDWSVTGNPTVKFDGTAKVSATVTNTVGATITYTCGSDTFNSVPSFTDVGVYFVNYTVEKTGYQPEIGHYYFTIEKGDITGFEIKANDTVKYDGAEKTSATVTVGVPADAEITYFYGNDEFDSVPKFTEVGEYTVSYVISKDGYNEVDGEYTFKIEKGDITGFEIKANDTVKYDGTEKASATVTVGVPADAKITYFCGNDTFDEVPGFTAVGVYEVSYTISKDGYNDVTGEYTFEIVKGDITGFEIEANEPVVYDGEDHESATVTVGVPADAKITFFRGDTEYIDVPEFTDAGVYTVSYIISKDGYNDVTGIYTFAIDPAAWEPDIELFEKAEYDGKAHPVADMSKLPKGAIFRFALTDENGNYEREDLFDIGEVPAFTEVGKYYLIYAAALDDNHEEHYGEFVFEIVEPAPETGDTFNLGLWLTVAALTAAAGIVLVLRRKEQA